MFRLRSNQKKALGSPLYGPFAPGLGAGASLDAWIFANGTWSDTGVWQDLREWASAGLFYEGIYWDGGLWADGEDW